MQAVMSVVLEQKVMWMQHSLTPQTGKAEAKQTEEANVQPQ